MSFNNFLKKEILDLRNKATKLQEEIAASTNKEQIAKLQHKHKAIKDELSKISRSWYVNAND